MKQNAEKWGGGANNDILLPHPGHSSFFSQFSEHLHLVDAVMELLALECSRKIVRLERFNAEICSDYHRYNNVQRSCRCLFPCQIET